MKKGKKIAAMMAICGTMAVLSSGCGKTGSDSADADHTYSIWLYSAQDASYYTDYADNTALQYLLNKTWGEEEQKIKLEFLVPPSGSELNNYETMITSGEYPDLLMGAVADTASNMYKDGMILDLTDYVKEYMPNYYNYLQTSEKLYNSVVYNIDGEDRILSITGLLEDSDYYFSGICYRRDWIVKYGKNPQTGEAFTGGYTDQEDPDSWVDDVVFPSGNTDPVYISDWEWMFEIFTEAQVDLGIEDSYCFSMYYPGYTWSGGLVSSFGGSVPVFYKDADGNAQFGGDQDQMRAYLQCLNVWYENGWLDQDFNERTSDIFYAIDDTSVRQGKVGMWQGVQSELGGRMDLNDGGYTEGIYVAGCALPINDVYGTEACKNVEPRCITGGSGVIGVNYYVMEGADKKDLPTLLSFLDYFYSDEGSLIYTIGLNKDQLTEVDADFYEKYGMSEGAYTIGEDGRYVLCDALQNDSASLSEATNLSKLPGYKLVSSVDRGYSETYENSLKSWIQWENEGMINGSAVINNMTSEDSKAMNDTQTKVLNYMELHAYEFIKGIQDIDSDKDWGVWCTMLTKYNYQKVLDMLQPYLDEYPI